MSKTNSIDIDGLLKSIGQPKIEVSDDEIKIKVKLQKQADELSESREIIRKLARRDYTRDALLEALGTDISKVIKIPAPKIGVRKKIGKPEDAVLLVSDAHIGEKIEYDMTNGINEYNIDIFKKRLQTLAISVHDIVSLHSHMYPLENLWLLFLGDILDNETIYKGHKLHIETGVMRQFKIAVEEFTGFIAIMLQLFPHIHVIGLPGNHGRIGMFGEATDDTNWDNIFYHALRERFANNDRIDFYISDSWFTVLDIKGHNCLCWHGECVKSSAGIPWGGVNKALQAMIGMTKIMIDYMFMGHYHTAGRTENSFGEMLVNGAFPGPSPFELKQVMKASQPSQWFFGMNESRGITWSYKLDLNSKPKLGILRKDKVKATKKVKSKK